MTSFTKRSKFHHLFATPHKRQFCYESLSVADGAQIRSDGGTAITASNKFFAYPDRSGGGSSVAVLPLTSYGRRHVPTSAATYQTPLYKVHTSKVHCVSFSPHDQEVTLLASGSSGGDVHIYSVPEDGLIEDFTGSSNGTYTSMNTDSAVYGLSWHPSYSNIVAVHHPKSIEVLDAEQKCSVWSSDAHLQDVHSFAWSWDGKTAVTTCKDKIIRLFDSRTGAVSNSTLGHGSWRPSIATWAGRDQYFYTTGVGSDRSREIRVWDIRKFDSKSSSGSSVGGQRIDSGSSVMIPTVDTDTGLMYVTSRGDSGFRIMEWIDGKKLKEINNCRIGGEPVLDVCLLPKSSLDLMGCEVARLLRLTQGSVDPVRVELPRKTKSNINTDVYIDTLSRSSIADSVAFVSTTSGTDLSPPSVVSIEKALASVGGCKKNKKNMTENSAPKEEEKSSYQGETKGATTTEEDEAAERRRKRAKEAFGGQSKYKYIRLEAPGERNVNKTWYNLRMDTSDTSSMLIAATKEHFVVPWQSGGGGPMYVGQVDKPGKAVSGNAVPLLRGHKERVNVIAFNPQDDLIFASGSDDADIRLWRLDSGGVSGDCVNTMEGHIRSIRSLLWNPNCNNVLASSSSDDTVKLWDASNQSEAAVTIEVGEAPLSMSYNYKGDGLAIAGRKKVIFVDPRKGGELHTTIDNTHEGSKGQRCVWLRDENLLFTVGTTKSAAREFKIWDIRNSNKPLCSTTIDR
jgi:coronin-1B/1C/6